MSERTCSKRGCGKPHHGRGLCNAHYLSALKAGALPGRSRQAPLGTWHTLTNIDPDSRTGDCEACGNGVPVYLDQGKGRVFCKKKLRIENRAHRLKKKYGLTDQQYSAMAQRQGERCLICQNVPDRLVVDHCHSSGRIRGLLCNKCNVAIGLLQDSPLIALAACTYLSEHA